MYLLRKAEACLSILALTLSVAGALGVLLPQPAGFSPTRLHDLARQRFGTRGCQGRVVVITGAAGGIGKELTQNLHKLGATVVALDKNETGLQDLAASCHTERIVPMVMDQSDLDSVARTACSICKLYDKIDVLVCNAGMTYRDTSKRTKHGGDLSFTVNYLSHVLFTEKLSNLLHRDSSRVVHMTSTYHWKVDGSEITPRGASNPPLAYLAGEPRSPHHCERAYMNSKLAQFWYGQKLAERGVESVCCCPTWAATGIGGEDNRAFLEEFAFPVLNCGPGVTSALNGILRTSDELGPDVLSSRRLIANSRTIELLPMALFRWICQRGWRDAVSESLVLVLLIGQRVTHRELIIQEASPEVTEKLSERDALYQWSLNSLSSWL